MRPFRPVLLVLTAALSLSLACGGGGSSSSSKTYYADADGDGYGDASVSQVLDSAQAGWVLDSTDCNDTAGSGASIHPGASEICDSVDNDCDPLTVDGTDAAWLGSDCDGVDSDLCEEGIYSCTGGTQVCSDASSDDLDLCDGVDNDCNVATADGADEGTLGDSCDGSDADQCSEGTMQCSGAVMTCSDLTGDNIDTCNNSDDDCDGTVDNDYVDGTVTYPDWDGSLLVKGEGCGTGACASGTVVCTLAGDDLECSTAGNASAEECNGLDDDCDGEIDEGIFCPASGVLDDTFGGDVNPADGNPDGFDIFIGNNNEYGFGVLPGTDGTIYVAGSYDGNQNDMALWRYTSSGVLDTTFGGDDHPSDGTPDGFVVYDKGSYDTGWAVALDASDRTYLAGHTHGGGSNYDMTLLRYSDAGVLDTSFGTSGVVTHDGAAGGANQNDHGVAVTLDPDEKIYVAGYSQDGVSSYHIALWRYTSSGVLDTTFGGDTNPTDGVPDGFVTYNGGGGDHYGLAVAYDSAAGRVYVAGYRNSASQDLVLLCYDSAGVLDTTFDGDGILTHDGASTGNNAVGLGVTLDSTGRVYVAGSNQSDSILWRFNSSGALDTTFGGDTSPADGTPDGFVLDDGAAGGTGIDSARSIALDESGLIYVTGFSQGTNEDMVLWRYTANGVLDTTFNAPHGFIVQSGVAGGSGVDRGTSVAVGVVDTEKVYVTGYSHSGTGFDMVIWRIE